MHTLPWACTTQGWALHSFPPHLPLGKDAEETPPRKEHGVSMSAHRDRQQKGPVLHLLTQFIRALHAVEASTLLQLLKWRLNNKKILPNPTNSWTAFLFHMRQWRALCSPGNPMVFPPSAIPNSHLLIQSLTQRLDDLVQINISSLQTSRVSALQFTQEANVKATALKYKRKCANHVQSRWQIFYHLCFKLIVSMFFIRNKKRLLAEVATNSN